MRLDSLTGLLAVFIAVFVDDTYAALSCCQAKRQDLKNMTLMMKLSNLKTDVNLDNGRIKRDLTTIIKILNIDACNASPCQNEGICSDKVNGYTCNCKVGYSGINCQTVAVGELKDEPIVTRRWLHSTYIRDLAVTSRGHIVVTSGKGSTAQIYDSDFKPIKDIGKRFYHVALTNDEQLVFTDWTNTIYFYTVSGRHIRSITVKGSSTVLLGITSLSTGQLVVCYGKEKRVFIVDPSSGDSTPFSAPGTVIDPYYVTTNSKGVIIVSDFDGHAIKGLDQAGNVVFSYGSSEEQLSLPNGVYTDSKDFILVADRNNDRIQLLTPEGNFHSHILTEMDGVDLPMALRINNAGQLLVGDRSGQLFIITYRNKISPEVV
ncbi:unnamed protein product [Owenia fusiformis]|uniref:EGF-like domain-containing protein n=1 Tax=Owenia fusiformis TaxID=6347 RepID=A0A8S4P8E0_OWEFU|nr:unnamed protein product [Owenia fusiformis]